MSDFIKREKSFILTVPVLIIVSLFARSSAIHESGLITGLIFALLFSVIIYAAFGVVHHAELLAHKFGEPYGTMILTFSAVTVEVIMVAAMMLHADKDPALARDTIFSTIMILINGLIGIIMLLGGFRYGEQKYNLKSTNSFLSMIIGIVGLGLIIPNFIDVGSHSAYAGFLIISSLALYGFFIRMQSKEHNYYFTFKKISVENETGLTAETTDEKKKISGFYHTLMLLLTIVTISLLAEYLSITVDDSIAMLNLPEALAGLIISIIIVSPEGLTAIRAGLGNDMQRVINISLGSVLSTVSLTIPAVLVVGIISDREVTLGLTAIQAGMLIVSLVVSMLSCKEGETNALQGFIHVVLFLTFVFMIFI